ncbi:hypothetical protein PAXINDRAFT_44002, partial [Paxillus involutus ATCC 200175]
ASSFQQHSFGRGGVEGGAVIVNAQDGSRFKNANFITSKLSILIRCRMYHWNTASPCPDGDMEVGIVIYELVHGPSTRLTAG